jgi:hypothetical protein
MAGFAVTTEGEVAGVEWDDSRKIIAQSRLQLGCWLERTMTSPLILPKLGDAVPVEIMESVFEHSGGMNLAVLQCAQKQSQWRRQLNSLNPFFVLPLSR